MRLPLVALPFAAGGVILAIFFVFGQTYTYYESTQQVLSDSTPGDPILRERPEYSPETIEFLIHQKVNDHRMTNNQTSLISDSGIGLVARAHADDMNTRNYYSHYSPEGDSAEQRGVNAGYVVCGDRSTVILENDYSQRLAEFESEQHRNNAEINRLNQKINSYNKEISQFTDIRNTRDDIRDFHPNTGLITSQQLQKELTALSADSQKLQTVSRQLDAEHNQLSVLRDEINSRIESGMTFSGLSENISHGYLYSTYTERDGVILSYDWLSQEQLATDIVNGWITSPEHNENMLIEFFNSEGIGISIDDQTHEVYAVQNFC